MFCIVVVQNVLFVIWVLSVIVILDSDSLYRVTKWHIVPPLPRFIILNPAIYFEYSFKLPYLRSYRHWEPKRTGAHGTPRSQDRILCFHCQLMIVLLYVRSWLSFRDWVVQNVTGLYEYYRYNLSRTVWVLLVSIH